MASSNKEALSPGEFIELLEQTRVEFLEGKSPYRGDGISGKTKEELAASKRRFHTGGDPNHRFEGERYLNTTDREIRRKQLRKLVDEGGQTTVGGPMASHPTLARWHSVEMGPFRGGDRRAGERGYAAGDAGYGGLVVRPATFVSLGGCSRQRARGGGVEALAGRG